MSAASGEGERGPALPARPPLRVPLAPIAPGERRLPPEAASYVVRVHRLRASAGFVVFDPERAVEADAVLVSVDRHDVTARIGEPRAASRCPRRRVTLIQGAGKGDKMDAVVRDATELGVTRIIPLLAARSVARPAPDRCDRWRRIAVEAARQCGRGDAPRIDPPAELAAALAAVGVDAGAVAMAAGAVIADAGAGAVTAPLGLCLDPRAESPLGARLRGLPAGAEVAFVVGPEGGLTDEELDACAAAGFARARLGRLTLRTETVCAAVLGALLALSDDEEA